MLEQCGQRATFVQAYPHRGPHLASLPLYDYMSVVMIRRRRRGSGGGRGVVEFDNAWTLSETWVQVMRKPGQFADVCLNGYLGMDFGEEDAARLFSSGAHGCGMGGWNKQTRVGAAGRDTSVSNVAVTRLSLNRDDVSHGTCRSVSMLWTLDSAPEPSPPRAAITAAALQHRTMFVNASPFSRKQRTSTGTANNRVVPLWRHAAQSRPPITVHVLASNNVAVGTAGSYVCTSALQNSDS